MNESLTFGMNMPSKQVLAISVSNFFDEANWFEKETFGIGFHNYIAADFHLGSQFFAGSGKTLVKNQGQS